MLISNKLREWISNDKLNYKSKYSSDNSIKLALIIDPFDFPVDTEDSHLLREVNNKHELIKSPDLVLNDIQYLMKKVKNTNIFLAYLQYKLFGKHHNAFHKFKKSMHLHGIRKLALKEIKGADAFTEDMTIFFIKRSVDDFALVSEPWTYNRYRLSLWFINRLPCNVIFINASEYTPNMEYELEKYYEVHV